MDSKCNRIVTFMAITAYAWLCRFQKPGGLSSPSREALMQAINKRCNCGIQKSAIDDGEFSCQTMIGHVVYRSKINGTSDIQTASEFLAYIEDWVTSEGTFLLDDVFRLRVSTSCPLRIATVSPPARVLGRHLWVQLSLFHGQMFQRVCGGYMNWLTMCANWVLWIISMLCFLKQ